MTVTVREKGKTLEESGGVVLTADSWLGPDIPALKELAEFEMKYWKAIAPESALVSAEQMAAVAAMYPMIKPAMDRLNQEKVNLKGTPLATTMTFEGVKSKAQVEEQSKSSSGGGLSGMLARKMAKKDDKPARHDLHDEYRDARDCDCRRCNRPRYPGRVQAEKLDAIDVTGDQEIRSS